MGESCAMQVSRSVASKFQCYLERQRNLSGLLRRNTRGPGAFTGIRHDANSILAVVSVHSFVKFSVDFLYFGIDIACVAERRKDPRTPYISRAEVSWNNGNEQVRL